MLQRGYLAGETERSDRSILGFLSAAPLLNQGSGVRLFTLRCLIALQFRSAKAKAVAAMSYKLLRNQLMQGA